MRFIPLLAFAMYVCSASSQEAPIAGFDVLVKDESGKILNDVIVKGLFEWRGQSNNITEMTSQSGKAFVAARSESMASVLARKEGYYDSGCEAVAFRTILDGKWQPYGKEVSLVLRRIVHPVPLMAISQLQMEMPTPGAYGFDLQKHDWVEPFGKGKVPDFVFDLQREGSRKKGKASLTLRFSRPGDGLISVANYVPGGSVLRMPREAPEDGYQPTVTWEKVWLNPQTAEEREVREQMRKDQGEEERRNPRPAGYFFRVRTVLDENGKVVSALYGKIDCGKSYSEWHYVTWEPGYPGRSPRLTLTYYLNPTGSRNLEFDLKHNLFTDIPWNQPHFP